jgi:hypothetical protein
LPLKVKCTREKTSPGRGGSDPPRRAAPREMRGYSRVLANANAECFGRFSDR